MGSWSRGNLDHIRIYLSEYENCQQETFVQWMLKLISHYFLLCEVPQTSPPQQQGSHLTFRNTCDPETTPKPQSLRSTQHALNRHSQTCPPWKTHLFSRVQPEEALSCITQMYRLTFRLSSAWVVMDTLFPAELQARLENGSGEWSIGPTAITPAWSKVDISHSWLKPL